MQTFGAHYCVCANWVMPQLALLADLCSMGKLRRQSNFRTHTSQCNESNYATFLVLGLLTKLIYIFGVLVQTCVWGGMHFTLYVGLVRKKLQGV